MYPKPTTPRIPFGRLRPDTVSAKTTDILTFILVFEIVTKSVP